MLITIEAWDTNCPQHITQRFSEAELAPVFHAYEERIAGLSAEIEELKTRLRAGQPGDERFS